MCCRLVRTHVFHTFTQGHTQKGSEAILRLYYSCFSFCLVSDTYFCSFRSCDCCRSIFMSHKCKQNETADQTQTRNKQLIIIIILLVITQTHTHALSAKSFFWIPFSVTIVQSCRLWWWWCLRKLFMHVSSFIKYFLYINERDMKAIWSSGRKDQTNFIQINIFDWLYNVPLGFWL